MLRQGGREVLIVGGVAVQNAIATDDPAVDLVQPHLAAEFRGPIDFPRKRAGGGALERAPQLPGGGPRPRPQRPADGWARRPARPGQKGAAPPRPAPPPLPRPPHRSVPESDWRPPGSPRRSRP